MSRQAQTAKSQKTSFSIDPRYIGRLVGTLTGICLVVALLLGIVNYVTKPLIDASQKAKQDAAMAQVLAADSYEKLEFTTANVTAPWEPEVEVSATQPTWAPPATAL